MNRTNKKFIGITMQKTGIGAHLLGMPIHKKNVNKAM